MTEINRLLAIANDPNDVHKRITRLKEVFPDHEFIARPFETRFQIYLAKVSDSISETDMEKMRVIAHGHDPNMNPLNPGVELNL